MLSDIIESFANQEDDPRTKDWFLVTQPWILHAISFAYLYFVLRCGPNYMKDKRAYKLKTFISYYNIFQIITNAWIVYAYIKNGMFTDISLICSADEIKRGTDPKSMGIAEVFFWTLMLKIVDLVETAVFVLRKKNRQISFLHLYHHISTIYIAYFGVRYYPVGESIFPVLVNSAIHVMMYTYYFLSSKGPIVQQIINPFKPYITIAQMVQFILLIIYVIQGFSSTCPCANWLPAILLFNLIMNFVLFYNFYRQNYTKKMSRNM